MIMEEYSRKRQEMVDHQLLRRGISDHNVLAAMRKVARHEFVPEDMLSYAYADEPLPIGEGQTISQPYIVAYMTEALSLGAQDRVLEIGTGSGYQSAVLAELVKEVFTVEIKEGLSLSAQKTLARLEYSNVHFLTADGKLGWEEYATFDAILVTAAPARIPSELQSQLRSGGKMIIPVGSSFQELVLITRADQKYLKKKLIPVRFVPLV